MVLSALQNGSAFQARSFNFVRCQTASPSGLPLQRAQPARLAASSAAAAAATAATEDMSRDLPNDDNGFRLVRHPDTVELQTAAYKLAPRPSRGNGNQNGNKANRDDDAKDAGADVEITLVSMVHLADQDYYTEIMLDASSYDRVLFELIAGSDVSGLDARGNRAVTEYVYPTREQVGTTQHSRST